MMELINPLTTSVPHHIENSQLNCYTNLLTGFYMMGKIGREWVNFLGCLTHLRPVFLFYTPENSSKLKVSDVLARDKRWEHWSEMKQR